MSSDKYFEKSEKTYKEVYDEPLSLKEYVDRVLDDDTNNLLKRGAEYLLAAIEDCGTRTVFEAGEEIERYVFFDDPYNDGKNAILGNTKVLNEFVESLRGMATGSGKTDKIEWIEGPTASGKSEFKRCLVNGLNGFSQKPEGKRYTLEVNITGRDNEGKPRSSVEGSRYDEQAWYKSPVQADPLSIFPEKVRRELIQDLSDKNEKSFKHIPDLPPFLWEAYKEIRDDSDNFSEIIGEKRLRVRNYVIDYGEGVGILTSEDQGLPPKKRLVGSWDEFALKSRAQAGGLGRRDKRDFIYDGVLSQGNNVVSIIEDAMQHIDLLSPLLNVIDEKKVKIDSETYMNVDTLLILISNPDLTGQIEQQDELGQKDPLKALKRRMDKHEFDYLINPKLEAELIIKEVFGNDNVNTDHELSKPVNYRPNSDNHKELAPRTIEAASLYDVATRLDTPRTSNINVIDKALLMDKDKIIREGEEITSDIVSVSKIHRSGIPVTYTRDVISSILQRDMGRKYPDVILPQDLIEFMKENFESTPLFSDGEISQYTEKASKVRDYILEKQEEDVVSAIMENHQPGKAETSEYVDKVSDWVKGEELEDKDSRTMIKGFEVRYLGFNEANYKNDDTAREEVQEFRRELSKSISRKLHLEPDKKIDEIDFRKIPDMREKIKSHTWEDIHEKYKDLNLKEWRDPLSGTETEEVKNRTIEKMIELYDYSEKSAELVSSIVIASKLEINSEETEDEEDTENEEDTDGDDDDDNDMSDLDYMSGYGHN